MKTERNLGDEVAKLLDEAAGQKDLETKRALEAEAARVAAEVLGGTETLLKVAGIAVSDAIAKAVRSQD